MKNTSTKEQKKAIKATRATAEPEVDNEDSSEDCDNIQNCRGGHRMMKSTSAEEWKKAIKATRATAELGVDNADCSEDCDNTELQMRMQNDEEYKHRRAESNQSHQRLIMQTAQKTW